MLSASALGQDGGINENDKARATAEGESTPITTKPAAATM